MGWDRLGWPCIRPSTRVPGEETQRQERTGVPFCPSTRLEQAPGPNLGVRHTKDLQEGQWPPRGSTPVPTSGAEAGEYRQASSRKLPAAATSTTPALARRWQAALRVRLYPPARGSRTTSGSTGWASWLFRMNSRPGRTKPCHFPEMHLPLRPPPLRHGGWCQGGQPPGSKLLFWVTHLI